MTNAVGYVRQSMARSGETEDTSLSLDAQESAIRAYAARQGWTVTKVLRDHDLKGYDPTRPGIEQLLNAVGPDTVAVVFMLSRLARDNIMQETIYRQIKARGGSLVSVSEPHAEDFLIRGIMGVINEHHRQELGNTVANIIRERVRRGEHVGQAPYGYRSVDGMLVVEPEEAEIMGRIFMEAAKGTPMYALEQRLTEDGITRKGVAFDRRTIQRALRNATYAGGLRYKGESIWPPEGERWHEPLVSRQLWDQVQAWLEKRTARSPRTSHTTNPLAGLVYHECGKIAYARPSGNDVNRTRYWSFICGTRSGAAVCGKGLWSISIPKLVRAISAILDRDLRVDRDPDLLMRQAQERYDELMPGIEAERTELLTQIARIDQRTARAELLWTEGLRSLDWFKSYEAGIQEELRGIRAQLEALPKPLDQEKLRSMATMLANLPDNPGELGPEAQADLIRHLGKVVYGESGIWIAYDRLPGYVITERTTVPNRGRKDPRFR